MADRNEGAVETDKPKKRKVEGRKREKLRDERISSHQTGPDCQCSRFECFTNTTEADRRRIIDNFNSLESKNCQDQLLASLIKVCDVARRRSRKEDWTEANWHNKSFRYYIRNSEAAEIEVCIKGFCSLFGITENRVRRIREYLRDTG